MSFQDLSTIQCIIEDTFWTQSVKLIPFCIFSCFHRYKGWSHTVCVTLKTLLVHLLLVSSEYILEFKMYLLICIWSSHLKLSPRFLWSWNTWYLFIQGKVKSVEGGNVYYTDRCNCKKNPSSTLKQKAVWIQNQRSAFSMCGPAINLFLRLPDRVSGNLTHFHKTVQ